MIDMFELPLIVLVLCFPFFLVISLFKQSWHMYRNGVFAGIAIVASFGIWSATETYDVKLALAVVLFQLSLASVAVLLLVTALALRCFGERQPDRQRGLAMLSIDRMWMSST